MSPIESPEKKREGRKKRRREEGGETGIPEPTRRTGFCIVCSSKRTAGITHNQRESRPKSVGTKRAENMNQGAERIVKFT